MYLFHILFDKNHVYGKYELLGRKSQDLMVWFEITFYMNMGLTVYQYYTVS